MKKCTAFFLMVAIVALCVGFSSCSKDDGSIIGLWTYTGFSADIKNPTLPELEEIEKNGTARTSGLSWATIEFKADHTLVMNFGSEYVTGSWSTNDDDYILHLNGESIETDGAFHDEVAISIKGNVLTFTENHLDRKYTYYMGDNGIPNTNKGDEVNTTFRGAGFTAYALQWFFQK
jgi:hypothetical protein